MPGLPAPIKHLRRQLDSGNVCVKFVGKGPTAIAP
jgi:hypothetical protein